MPASGAISDRVRDLLPYTWSALLADPKYGSESLQRRIDIVKLIVFGEPMRDEDEEEDYPPIQQEYLATLSALQIIPAGIEFWMNSSISISTPGHASAESASYTDRAQRLRELSEELIARARQLAQLADIPSVVVTAKNTAPLVDTTGALITTDPAEWGRRGELGAGGWPRPVDDELWHSGWIPPGRSIE